MRLLAGWGAQRLACKPMVVSVQIPLFLCSNDYLCNAYCVCNTLLPSGVKVVSKALKNDPQASIAYEHLAYLRGF